MISSPEPRPTSVPRPYLNQKVEPFRPRHLPKLMVLLPLLLHPRFLLLPNSRRKCRCRRNHPFRHRDHIKSRRRNSSFLLVVALEPSICECFCAKEHLLITAETARIIAHGNWAQLRVIIGATVTFVNRIYFGTDY